MAKDLYIDVETYSEVDIKTSGAYKYIADKSFEIIILGYAIDEGPVVIVDLLSGEEIPEEFEEAIFDSSCIKHAHNAVFERLAFKRIGYDIPIREWRCTAIKASYCGLPASLDEVSKRLDLDDKKLDSGKALIKYFSCPCKATKVNGGRTRNMPCDAPDKWEQYKEYNKYDVLAEKEIHHRLKKYNIPDFEQELYILDQEINDNGIKIDLQMASNAIAIDEWYTDKLSQEVKDLTGLDNPNSLTQLRAWLGAKLNKDIPSLAKAEIPILIAECTDKDAKFVLEARQKLGKTSIKKYTAMLNCACEGNRARGLFQFYGANRTGRWAGRLIQLQNLPQNHIKLLETARQCVVDNDGELLELLYDDVSNALSQLIRTAFIAPEGKTFVVADFSAIEARVISWYADEEWRLEVFKTHGKIYEATAARMFSLPIEMITKGSDLRQKGKIAELALGYGGSLGAMKRMGGERMGLSDAEMMSSVRKWRKANEGIVDFWNDCEECAHKAVMYPGEVMTGYRGIEFLCEDSILTIKLPSGRCLFYRNARLKPGKRGITLFYDGLNQETKQWVAVDTYGGKLVENIVQATARDLLGYAMLNLRAAGYKIVMHVHDENIAECDIATADEALADMCEIMGQEVPWAEGLPLRADGYVTPFYKKD